MDIKPEKDFSKVEDYLERHQSISRSMLEAFRIYVKNEDVFDADELFRRFETFIWVLSKEIEDHYNTEF